MNSSLSQWLVELGFNDVDSAKLRFASMANDEVVTLKNGLIEKIEDCTIEDTVEDRLFSFVASASFRGERCCVLPDCRMKKAPGLLEFSALYADRLFLPLDLAVSDKSLYLREKVEGAIRMLCYLRPLLEAGLIIPTLPTVRLCKDCAAKIKDVSEPMRKISEDLIAAHVSEFSVDVRVLDGPRNHCLVVSLSGPEEYLEKGSGAYITEEIPAWLDATDVPRKLTDAEVLKIGALSRTFHYPANDFLLQNHFRKYGQASYLTDLPIEAEFFRIARSVTSDETIWRGEVIRNLTHSIPMFREVAREDLIKLRNDEGFAFKNYRNAIRRAVNASATGEDPKTVARRLWEDDIRPEVDRLQSRADALKRSAMKVNLVRGIPAAVAISAGLLGGHISNDMAHAIAVISGCALAGGLLPSNKGDAVEIKSEDYYFLLKASETTNA